MSINRELDMLGTNINYTCTAFKYGEYGSAAPQYQPMPAYMPMSTYTPAPNMAHTGMPDIQALMRQNEMAL